MTAGDTDARRSGTVRVCADIDRRLSFTETAEVGPGVPGSCRAAWVSSCSDGVLPCTVGAAGTVDIGRMREVDAD